MDFEADQSLKEWAKDKPLSILQLDPADRAVLRIADERDAIQKKTFTKWVNKHLKKANREVNDLFVDLQDGLNLISLLEVLSGEHLHREKGTMRFHMLQNVELVLNFLRFKKIKLVNIRPEDIVDGNPKLTLGLIWTIILHFQISDIVVGEEPNVSARDVLLRWARKSTHKYPGVRVADFTQSWRDGLAFNAIIHRNRPDLIDWRQIRQRNVRERLETAFHTAEKVGVTRLLDPEDVDTHEIDEKSIITYISSMYDVFPEPPPGHPLYDSESQALVSEYREVSSSLHLWIREKMTIMTERTLPNSLTELKRMSAESSKFKTDEVPQRQREKQKVQHIYRELQKYFEAVGEVDIEPELHVDVLEKNWTRLMVAHQEKDQLIQEEIKKYERLQRLVDKIQKSTKRVDAWLDDIETKLTEESSRIDRLHPMDAKRNVDLLEGEMRSSESAIQSIFQDDATLQKANHPQYPELHKRVSKLHQRWVSLRSLLHSKLITRLASLSFPVVEERTVTRQTRTVLETRLVDTNTHFRSLQQAIEWCKTKLKQVQEADYGTDANSVKSELVHHQREHREIDQFQSKVDHSVQAKNNFSGDELSLYMQHLNTLQKLYAELLSLSNKRLSDLETLLDFSQSAATQLSWLADKEQLEVARDWSDKDANVPALEQYYDSMMSELEKREVSVRSVMERGNVLLVQNHPGIKLVENTLSSVQSQWAHVLQLTLALETHLKTLAYYQAFYRDVRELDAWINSRDELLNTTYSTSEFNLDEGERLLKGMQELREELNARSSALAELAQRAQSVSPIKQRRLPVNRPIHVHAVCNYKHQNLEIEKDDRWLLHDNSALTKWRVSDGQGGADTNVPGVVFLIPPPDKEASDAVDRLHRQYDRTLALWQRKQLRMRQNMIFATIRVVRSWDLAQFVAMGADQRNAIRKALNEDAEKLLTEGDPADPQLRRLRREMDEVNRLFDEFERRARQEEESKSAARLITEQMSSLQDKLGECEKTLNSRIASSVPRDVHSLEHMVIQHKDFETELKRITPEVESLEATFRGIPRKSPALQSNYDSIMKTWNNLWNSSHLYIERLKCVEILLAALEEANTVISELEMKLTSFGDMPSDLEPLRNVHDDLIRLQNSIASQQPVMDQLIEDATNTRRVVGKSRERMRHDHADLDRTDDDVNAITQRWNTLCSQLVDRLRSCEAAYGLLENYGKTYQTEVTFIDEAYSKLNSLPPVTHAKHHIEPTKVLFTSIVERTQPLEQVNIDGGRFIREAKIYNMKLRRYWESASVWQPSLDAVKREEPARGESAVAKELDVLNHRFLALCAILQDRLKQIAVDTGDPHLLELVRTMEPAQLKTFRTEFSLFETTTELRTTTSYTSSQYTSTTEIERNGEGKVNGGETLHRRTRIEEGIGTDVIDCPGIVDPATGQVLSVGEAIRMRILDVRTGRINVPGGEPLSIEEAVERGYVGRRLGERLLGPSGILPGLSLLEAIQRELLEAEKSSSKVGLLLTRVKVREERAHALSLTDALRRSWLDTGGKVEDRFTGEWLPLEKAIKRGLIDPTNREIVDARRDTKLTLDQALASGLISDGKLSDMSLVEAYKSNCIDKPMTLKDSVDREVYTEKGIQSPTKKAMLGIREAVERGVLDSERLKSVVDTSTGELVTLETALSQGIILPEGKYVDKKNGEVMDVPSAVRKGLLTSVSIESVFDVDGFKDADTEDFLTLNEALDKGIVDESGSVLEPRSDRALTLEKATEEGLVRQEVYDMLVKKIGMMSAGKELSVYGAVIKGYLDPKTGRILDRKKRSVPYDEAVKKKLITQEGLDLLISLLNITLTTQTVTKTVKRYVPHVTMNYEEAVKTGLIDEQTQTYIEPQSGKYMTVESAIKQGLLAASPTKVDVISKKTTKTLTEETVIIGNRIETQTYELPPDGWYLKEAIEQRSFDPVTGLFTVPGTDRLVSFEECVRLEIINGASAKVVDPTKNRTLGLLRSIEKKVLDSTGHYTTKDNRKMTMKEAIDKNLVLLEDRTTLEGQRGRTIQVTKMSGRPDLVQVSEPAGTMKEIKESGDTSQPINVAPGVIFDPSTALVIFTDSGRSSNLLEALKDGRFPSDKVTVKDPNTGREISFTEAANKGVLDDNTGGYRDKSGRRISLADAAKYGVVTVKGTPLLPEKNRALVKDPKTGEEIPIEVAFQRGIVDENLLKTYEQAMERQEGDEVKVTEEVVIEEGPIEHYKTLSTAYISLEDDTLPSLGELTRGRVTTEPKYKVSIGCARSINQGPDQQAKPVVLQKMRKKVIEPRDGVGIGVIDKETADLLEKSESYVDESGQVSVSNGVDSNVGAITDPQRGDVLTIKEAVERGLLDDRTGRLVIPVARSLSVPALLEQGLYENGKIVHPETGAHLSLREAIVCEIVDPLSKMVEPTSGSTMTLEEAIKKGMVDGDSSLVKTKTGSLDLLGAAKGGIFEELPPPTRGGLPPAGMTLTVAVKRGLLDSDSKEIVHPITGVRKPVEAAIKDDFIMTIPCNVSPESVPVSEALDSKLIDGQRGVFVHPRTGEEMPLGDAVEKGLLVVKRGPEEKVVSVRTETVESYVMTKRTVALQRGYVLLDAARVRNSMTGEVMSLEEAARRGIVEESLDETDEAIKQDVVAYDTVDNRPIKMDEAVKKGIIDPKTGKVKDGSGKFMSVKDAAKLGLGVIVGAPILAGKAIYDAVKRQKSPEKPVPAQRLDLTLKRGKLPLKEAIHSGVIKPENCQISVMISGAPKDYTVREALDKGLVSLNTVVDAEAPDRVAVTEDRPGFKVEVSKHLTPKDLALRGAYDTKTGLFIDPKTGEDVTFEELVNNSGLFDPNRILVKDLNTPDSFVPIRSAFQVPLIDSETGCMTDPRTGKLVPFFEAVKLGWIVQSGGKAKKSKPLLSLRAAIEADVLDPVTATVKSPTSGTKMTLSEAIIEGVIDPVAVRIRHPVDDRLMSLAEAVDAGIADLNRSVLVDPKSRKEIDLESAYKRGFVRPDDKPISLEAVIVRGLYSPKTSKINDEITRQEVDLPESIMRGIVDPNISLCKDVKKDRLLSLEKALEYEVVGDDGKFTDTKTGKTVTLDIALRDGNISTSKLTLSLIEAILQEYYVPKKGTFLDPTSGALVPLSTALTTGFIDPKLTKIKDPHDDKTISTEDAIAKKLIDAEKGVFTYPFSITLDVANAKGFILPSNKPWTLAEALVHGSYDPVSGLMVIDGAKMTLKESLDRGDISGEAPTAKDPRTGDILSLKDAIETGIINPEAGTAADPTTGAVLNFYDALERGLIVPAKRRFSLPEAVFKGLYDPKSGKFTNPRTREKLQTDRAINKGVIDPASTMVKIDGKTLTFEHAAEESIVDQKTGTVRIADKRLDFQEAFEQGLLIEVRRPMSLREAIAKGVYDRGTGLFLDPKTGEYVSLSVAIESNLVDPKSVQVKDTKKGFWNKMTLAEAITSGHVDGQTGRVKDFEREEEVSLVDAFENGLVVDSGSAVSLQRAIHQGLYDEKTGKFTDANTGRKITLHEAIRRFIINPLLPCYWDRKDEKLLSLADTCRSGIIDRRTSAFREPGSNYPINLSVAMDLGLIVDIETAGFGLYESLCMGLYDVETRKFLQPNTGRKLTLQESVKEDLINSNLSIVKNADSGRYCKLQDAVRTKIVDDVKGVYNVPGTREVIDLKEAKRRGLIAPCRRSLGVEEAILAGLYRPKSGRFIDPQDNKQLDLKEALDNTLLTPETTALAEPNGQLRGLNSAIEDDTIDTSNCTVLDPTTKQNIPMDSAFEKGILVTVEKPLTLQEAARRGSIDCFRDPKTLKDCSLQDAIKYELIDPEVAVVKNPQTGKFISLKEAIQFNIVDPNRKASFIPQSSTPIKPLSIVFDQGTTVFLKEPLTFMKALESGMLDIETGKFTDPETKECVTLKDAVLLGIIDPDSVLVKDTGKRRLLKLPEAFKKGLVDERGNVLDTANSKLYNVKTGLESGVLTTDRLSLLEALDYGLYNPTTGGFTDPFCSAGGVMERRRLNLSEALKSGLIDPSTSVVKDRSTGRIASLSDAITSKILDPDAGRMIETSSGKSLDLLKAKDRGYIIPAETRQAMEEKYKLCDDTLKQLLEWMSEVEDRLANQDVAQEDLDQLRNQINILKLIKEELDSQQRTVSNCIDQVRVVVSTGSEYLTRDEVNGLERNGKSLRSRYDKANDKTDKLLRRLNAANEELSKFKTELGSFTEWMERARRILEERERGLTTLNRVDVTDASTRDFVSDVIAHQADLRFITMAAQKFFDESKEYLHVLNEFRTSLPSRLSHIEPMGANESRVRSDVTRSSADYKELLSRANALADRLSGVGGRQKEYAVALERFKQWFVTAEPRANKMLSEPLAADPHALEDQLSRTKALNADFLSQGRLVDNLKQALEALLRSVDGQISSSEMAQLENPVKDLTHRYESLCTSLSDRCTALDTALVQSQGVEDALDSVITWLSTTENTLKGISRPASLHKERLEEQVREVRVLMSDIESHRMSVDSVAEQARSLVASATNPRLAKRIETKMKDVQTRFEKLSERTMKRADFLAETCTTLQTFIGDCSELERWLIEVSEALSDGPAGATVAQSKLEEVAAGRDARREAVEKTLRDGRSLVAKKDVTDTSTVREKIKSIETQWRDLSALLDEKQRLGKARAEQSMAYEKLREQVLAWLTNMETRIARLEPVAVHMDTIKRQSDELKPLVKEHRDYGLTIDKLFELGNSLETLARPESPTRRRSSVSPVKRTSVTLPLVRRSSQEGGSPSPTKIGYSITSPVSPSGSSGFGSRRPSQETFHLEDMTAVQQELTEVNNRYSLLGVKLTDRQSELETTREELRKAIEHLKSLDSFLDKVQRSLPRESLPSTKDEADKTNRTIKGILEEMYEKQSLLESTKSGVNELLRRKPTAVGADNLGDQLTDVTSRWKSLNDTCKNRIQLLEDVKDLYDTHDNLTTWLNAKDKMMTALGPISSDPRMVQSQIQQVQVLREEFRAQAPQLSHLREVADSVLTRASESSETTRLSNKVTAVVERWNQLSNRLDSRAESLGAAVDSSREFDASLIRLKDALQGISDQIDSIPADKEPPEEQLRRMQGCERQLEGVRSLLADAEAAGQELCRLLAADSSGRAEIQSRVSALNRQYAQLQAKLDHKKAEIEAMLRDGREFEASCAKTLGWIADELGSMTERLQVSADRDILQQQLDVHEPIYKEVLSKEHEVIMLLDRGRERGGEGSVRQLENVKQQWDKLKREAVDRHTRLHTCMEHCRKYYRAVEGFIPWLSQAENKLDSMRPDSFTQRDVEKHLRDLSTFRNEVWKKSGEFEHLRSLGETFLGACDIDKEVVKQELSAIKARWDKLNNDLLSRTTSLEEIARRLTEMTDRIRDLSHSVQRCEDRLASHDQLGPASANDPAVLLRLKGVKEDAAALRKPLEVVRGSCLEVESVALDMGLGRSDLSESVSALTERLDDLESRLDDRCTIMQSAAHAIHQFNERLKGLTTDLTALETELDSMKPPGRDLKTVRTQQDQISTFINKVGRVGDDVNRLLGSADGLVDSGFAPDAVATRQSAETVARQLASIEERSRAREELLEATVQKLNEFQNGYDATTDDINHANEELRRLRPVGSEVDTIRSQQEEFVRFREDIVEPVGRGLAEVNRKGQSLVQSAGQGVSTTQLEKDLEKINDKWNALKEKLNDRSRKLDVGLLQSGKFQEALDGLSKWLTDTEEMVANQRPPSADYKVVKAQMQEQKFLKKMLLDRQGSMSSLVAMGREVSDGSGSSAVERQLEALVIRYDRLTEGAAARMSALESAMAVAKEFQDRLVPVVDWLDRTEKRVKDMELVPTDEEKIQQRIREHDSLHNEILRKKPALTDLTETGSQLMALVGEDEATLVADKVQETADRYGVLVEGSDSVGQLLHASRAGLRHLVLTYQQLQAWMEGMEQRLSKHRVLAVHTEKLLAQMDDLADLTEEIANHQGDVDSTVDSGLELMKHISGDEAIQLKDKLDSLQRRYNELTTRGADLLKQTQEALPLVQQFHNAHGRLVDWMMGAESQLQSADPREEDINRLEHDIQEFRPVLENLNQIGPQLCSLSAGEGASTIEGLVTRDNRRFDSIAEQIQRKAERLHLSKQRSLEVLGDIDSLLEWFREVEAQLREAEPPSSEPNVIRLQLKEHKALNDDIASQKGRVRDVLLTGKKVLRESTLDEDASLMRDKMSDLRETMESVWTMSGERLGVLEQALGLADHLLESHGDLAAWLSDMETQVRHLPLPAIRPDLIAQQQDRTEMLLQSIGEHKPLVDKLNKTGEALIKLVADDEGSRVQEILDSDNARYAKLRADLKSRQETLEKALQESSQFSDKLEGMLRALASTADEVSSAEPVSAHVPKIRQQQKENQALVEDLHKREEAFNAVKKAAHDVISKAPNAADPAIKDVKRKLEKLSSLWDEVQDATKSRSKSLEEALEVAARFWNELQLVMSTLADLESSLSSQEPPAVRPQAIHQQQQALQEIKAEIDQTKPEVEGVRRTGHALMSLCGEPDKPEVKKHIEDLDTAWDTVTALFAKREENLINAMEKAMEFHETLQDLLEFLERAEDRFAKLGPLGSDIGTVKHQIGELKSFKAEVDPHMVKVEALNRQAQELTERTSAEQAAGLKESLTAVNARWEELHRGLAERNRQLENGLLRLGQFQHALSELLAWIEATDVTLDKEIKAVAGDPQLLEVELAKLKVLANDIQAHQASVDTLNDAGRQLIESARGTQEASATQEKLGSLNKRWRALMEKAMARQAELEEALRDAQRFAAEIQDLLSWLGEVDGVIAMAKPVGGLPETASEQLDRFMDVYNELESTAPKVEAVLATGQEYLKRSSGGSAANLNSNLKTLKSRWESVTARANDKKIKLEIALKEATEFHEALQAFVDWLTLAEKTLTNLKPVSRVLETILQQIEDHKAFQKEVGAHRETMIQLDKKGTHLKYFSQKQDVILIKNLLISVQHRWERVVSKSAERTRALDHGYKEAKEFSDAWSSLMNWLGETERVLDQVEVELGASANDPVKLKQRLNKHKETQKALAAKQPQYDATLRAGKVIRERAPKSDEAPLKSMVAQLKDKWNSVCAKSVDRQRKLEEALLYCGQFKDALEALLDWLKKTNKSLAEDTLVHGDLDTVNALIDQHKVLEAELTNRSAQMESVEKTGRELAGKAGADGQAMRRQLDDLSSLWRQVNSLANQRSMKLEHALKQAEELHKSVHMLLEWLSDAEMKLRFVDSLPDDETETRNQITEHDKFMREMRDKELEKDDTIRLGELILSQAHPDGAAMVRNWITIVQSRWEEVAVWAAQRRTRLEAHLKTLMDLDDLLEELLAWLAQRESTLNTLESEKLPDDIPTVQGLIAEHQEFMEKMAERQADVDIVCKAKQQKLEKEKERKPSTKKASTPSKEDTRQSTPDLHDLSRKASLKSSRDNLGTLDRKGSRGSPGRDIPDGMMPHIGPRFPPKGSKAAEPVFRTVRARLLWDRWRGVWLMAWERQRRLQEHLNHLQELERLANFSWDDWRKRFLKFMNHKKSRLTDLFRKMDKNNDNLIPREDFIEGIVKTKFDTSRLEMGAVADMFDHNSEGVIDWKEFIAALRPDWQENQPKTEADKIHDEVKRLVMLCTCRQKFRVFQVGEGKYRFGDSQKLRLVRILRSTVMVRVGGGWVALDEFLLKNDPCRAKGRTNIELREQFILADGVSQSMSAFKPKASSAGLQTSQRSVSTGSTQGPITKVRERSSRSIPMGSHRGSTGSRGGQTPGSVDSLSDCETSPHGYTRTPSRKTSALRSTGLTPGGSLPGSRNSSRPASRQGSKPPSRHGSSLSLASSDDGTPSRIPRRSVPTVRSGTTTPTPRKLTVPATVNGRSKSPNTSIKSNIYRASSIPTLTGVGAYRGRTPSGSATPTTSSSSSKFIRRESADSKSSEQQPKTPFRL